MRHSTSQIWAEMEHSASVLHTRRGVGALPYIIGPGLMYGEKYCVHYNLKKKKKEEKKEVISYTKVSFQGIQSCL